MAATRSDEGQRQCCLDNVRMWSSGPAKKYGDHVKNRHKWSAGRRACRYNGTRHLSEVPLFVAPFGAPLPHACEGKENEGAARASPCQGPMSHVCRAV